MSTKQTQTNREKNHDKHAERMLKWGQGWATPLMITFSLGALISLGGTAMVQIAQAITTGRLSPELVQEAAILLVAIVGVVGMDFVMINKSIEIRDRQVNDQKVGWGLWANVYFFAFIEACTFAFVAWQLDKPASPFTSVAAFVTWLFILLRAVGFPVAGIQLATLAKKPLGLMQIGQNQLIVVNDTLERKLSDHGDEYEIDQLLGLSLTWEEVVRAPDHQTRVMHMQRAIHFYRHGEFPSENSVLGNGLGSEAQKPGKPGGGRTRKPTKQNDIMSSDQAPVGDLSQSEPGQLPSDELGLGSKDLTGPVVEEIAHDQPLPVPSDPLSVGSEDPQERSDEQDSQPSAQLGKVGPTSLEGRYALPGDLTLTTELKQSQVGTYFGVSDSSLSRKATEYAAMGIGPTFHDGANWYPVWQILWLYEHLAFMNSPKATETIGNMVLEEEPAMNGHAA